MAVASWFLEHGSDGEILNSRFCRILAPTAPILVWRPWKQVPWGALGSLLVPRLRCPSHDHSRHLYLCINPLLLRLRWATPVVS